MYQQAKVLVLTLGLAVLAVVASLVVGYVMASPTFGWTGVPACHLQPHFACLHGCRSRLQQQANMARHSSVLCFACGSSSMFAIAAALLRTQEP